MRILSAFSVLATELELPVGLLVVLVALGTIQIVLLVWALVDLVRREQVALLPKWGWVIVILLANLVGSLLYVERGPGGRGAGHRLRTGGSATGSRTAGRRRALWRTPRARRPAVSG